MLRGFIAQRPVDRRVGGLRQKAQKLLDFKGEPFLKLRSSWLGRWLLSHTLHRVARRPKRGFIAVEEQLPQGFVQAPQKS